MKVPELRRRDMKRGTFSPEEDQRLIPAVRTVAKDAGNETRLRSLRETPSLHPGPALLMTPRQQTAKDKLQQETQHAPPPSASVLKLQSKQA